MNIEEDLLDTRQHICLWKAEEQLSDHGCDRDGSLRSKCSQCLFVHRTIDW